MKVEWHQPAKETYNLKNVPYACAMPVIVPVIGIRQNVCFPWASMIGVYLSDIWFLKKL
jgi:hypothetical protein